MSRRFPSFLHSLIVNSCAALVFIVTVSALAVVGPATAQDVQVENVSWFGGHGGWGRGGASAKAHCEEGVDHFVEELMEHADEEVEFTATQKGAWDDLIAAIRTSGADVASFCARVDEARGDSAAPAPERLALAEEAVIVGLEAIRTIRPAFDAFYETLDEEQREMLDGMAGHRRHRGWWH